MKLILTLIILLFYNIVQAQLTPNLTWVKTIGSGTIDEGRGIHVDEHGNIYSTGFFTGTVDFNPDPNTTFNLIATGMYDMYILKLDSIGNFIWVKQIKKTYAWVWPAAIDVDNNGNVYTTGWAHMDTDFDPDPVAQYFFPQWGAFVLKLDSTGSFVWVKQFTGLNNNGGTVGRAIKLDNAGNVYTMGQLGGIADFDPDSFTVWYLGIPGNDDQTYITKLDPSGNFVWAVSFAAVTSPSIAESIGIDSLQNVYCTGSFKDTVDFDTDLFDTLNLITNGTENVYILKLNFYGELEWVKQFDNALAQQAPNAYALTADQSGNVYTSGIFRGVVDFDPDSNVVNNLGTPGTIGMYVMRLNTLGDLSWVREFTTTNILYPTSMCLDKSSNIYCTGGFIGTADFDPETSSSFNLTSNFTYNPFILKLNQSGSFQWAAQFACTSYAWGNCVTVDSSGFVYTCGRFNDTIDFDPSPLNNYSIVSNGDQDIFIHKMSQNAIAGIKTNLFRDNIAAYPNPSSSQITIDFPVFYDNLTIKLFSELGQIVFEKTNFSGNTFTLDVSYLVSGIYIVKIISGNEVKMVKVIKD